MGILSPAGHQVPLVQLCCEDVTGIRNSEFLVNGPVLGFCLWPPGRDRALECVQMADSGGSQAFTRHQADFHLGNVEPTRVLRRVVHLESPPEPLRLLVAQGRCTASPLPLPSHWHAP
jgi:hypothetical protein